MTHIPPKPGGAIEHSPYSGSPEKSPSSDSGTFQNREVKKAPGQKNSIQSGSPLKGQDASQHTHGKVPEHVTEKKDNIEDLSEHSPEKLNTIATGLLNNIQQSQKQRMFTSAKEGLEHLLNAQSGRKDNDLALIPVDLQLSRNVNVTITIDNQEISIIPPDEILKKYTVIELRCYCTLCLNVVSEEEPESQRTTDEYSHEIEKNIEKLQAINDHLIQGTGKSDLADRLTALNSTPLKHEASLSQKKIKEWLPTEYLEILDECIVKLEALTAQLTLEKKHDTPPKENSPRPTKGQQKKTTDQGILNNHKQELHKLRQQHEKQIKDLENAYKSLQEENRRLQRTIQENSEKQPLANKPQTSQAEIDKLTEELKQLKNDKGELTKRFTNLNRDNLALSKNLQAEKGRTQQLKENLRNEKNAHKKEQEKLQTEIDKLKQQLNDSDRRSNQPSSTSIEKLQGELREVRTELEDTKTRLSKVMGQKLTDNNPNIADLSDKNRPTKLAEQYSELYDNQWTDAYEVLEAANSSQTDFEKITILKELFTHITTQVQKRFDEEDKSIAKIFGQSSIQNLHENIRKPVKDALKAGYAKGKNEKAEAIFQDLKKSPAPSKLTTETITKLESFIKEAAKLAGFMAVQDPPVVIDQAASPDENFDTDIYKAYTTSGPKIDYVVWPALKLCKDGPLLCKGVAQGKK